MFWKLSCLFFLTIAVGVSEPGGDQLQDSRRLHRRSIRKAASIGGSKILECDINYPGEEWVEHIITWRKQGIEVPIFIQFNGYPPHIDAGFQGRIRLVEQASIEVGDIRTKDEGWYECSIVFLDGDPDPNPSNGTWIYLSVNSPPVLGEASPSFLIQQEGDTVDFFCEATATPEPTVSWFKDGKELNPSDRVIISGNRVQVKNLERMDGGVYTCQFKNVVGQVAHIIKLVIEGEGWISSGNAYIMVPPKNTTANEGTKVTLYCQAEGYPNNISYRWFKNKQDIQTVPGLMTRAGVFADGRFVISSVIKEDTGWYKCRPSNGLAPPPEAEAYLNITYLPRVLSMPVRLYLPRGMMGRIDCPVEANPPATLIVWSKNEKVVEFSRTKRMKTTKSGTLVIYSVIATDEGRYACTPYSPLGAGQPSTPVQVLVRDPPHFVVRPKPIYQRQPTQSVTMPCVAEGDPKPSVTWRKADGSFPSTTKTLQDDGNLTIVSLGKEDHGTYECVANNIVTSVITSTLLIIEITTPHAPYNVTVEPGQFSAKVSWLPAYDGGYPQHYVLWYKVKNSKSGSEEWHTLRVVPDEATSITVYKLLADTTYQFTVLSRNRLGDGLFSKIVNAKTKAASSNDHDTTVTNAYEVHRNPEEPDESDRKNGHHPPRIGYVPELATALPTDQYGITYIPAIIRNIGPKPAPPYNLTVRLDREKGLLISWLPPKNKTVPVTYYSIQYRTVGQWVPLVKKIVDSTFYRWTTASRGARYSFRVFSYSNTAASKPSAAVNFYTGNPMEEGVQISEGMIGGIIGGLLFLIVAFILAFIAVKIFNKRKQREKAMRYGNVKYFGPKQVEANKNELSQFGDSRGGVISVADCWRTRIFTLQNGDEHDDYYSVSTVSEERALPPQLGYYDNLMSEQVNAPPRAAKSHRRKARYQLDISHPIGRISRGPDGKFILSDTKDYEERYVNLAHCSDNYYSESPGVKYRSHSYRNTSAKRHSADGAIVIRRQSSDSSDSDQYVQIPVQFDHHGNERGGLVPPARTQLVVDSTGSPYHDGVIIRPLLPSLPQQHRSMKPEYRRAYVTSSPQAETGGSAPFITGELSSVLPSFTTVPSHSQLPAGTRSSRDPDPYSRHPRGPHYHQPLPYKSRSIPSDIPALPLRGGVDYNPVPQRRRSHETARAPPLNPRPEVRMSDPLPDPYTFPGRRAYTLPRLPRTSTRTQDTVPPRLVVSTQGDTFHRSPQAGARGLRLYPGSGANDPLPWEQYIQLRDARHTPKSRRHRSSSNESGELTYTRDQLERAVDAVRKVSSTDVSPRYHRKKAHHLDEQWIPDDEFKYKRESSPKKGSTRKKDPSAYSAQPTFDNNSYYNSGHIYDEPQSLIDSYSRPPRSLERKQTSSYPPEASSVYDYESEAFNIYRDPVKPYHPRRSSSFTPGTPGSDRRSRSSREDDASPRARRARREHSESRVSEGETRRREEPGLASYRGNVFREGSMSRHRSPPTYLRPSPEGSRGLPTNSPDTTSRSSGLGSSKKTSQSTPSVSTLQAPLTAHRRRGSSPAATGERRGHGANTSSLGRGRRSSDIYMHPRSPSKSHGGSSGLAHSSQTSGDENYEFDPDASESDLINALKNSTYPDMEPAMLDRLHSQGPAVEMHPISTKHADTHVSDSQRRCARLMEEYASRRRNHRDKSHESGYYGDASVVACKEIESEML